MAEINVENATHVYPATDRSGHGVSALRDVSFAVKSGEACVIVGPSGCGKSTLLRIIAGLLQPTDGLVTVNSVPVKGPSSNAAVVFQEYSRSLFPWLTVEQNVAFALEGEHSSRSSAAREATGYLEAVGLGSAKSRYPWQLSGGMQQRVAIARALALEPRVLLLDEPFGSVDALARFALEDLVLQTAQRFGLSILLVTHDVDEAVYMADRIFVMKPDGRLKSSFGTQVDLDRPRHQARTRNDARFAGIRAQILSDLEFTQVAS